MIRYSNILRLKLSKSSLPFKSSNKKKKNLKIPHHVESIKKESFRHDSRVFFAVADCGLSLGGDHAGLFTSK